MGGAPRASVPIQDDPRIKSGEKLWRFIEHSWYQETPPGSGHYSILIQAFLDEVSLVREILVTERDVDSVRAGKFLKHGIVELTAEEIRQIAGCWLVITPDSDWPNDAHVLIYRTNGSKRLRPRHPEPPILTALANGRPLRRMPRP